MSFLWQQRTQREKEQKKNLEDVNQLLLESILPTKVSKYYMEEDRNAVSSLSIKEAEDPPPPPLPSSLSSSLSIYLPIFPPPPPLPSLSLYMHNIVARKHWNMFSSLK